MTNALSAAQRRYDDMEPPTDDYDTNVSLYIDKYARGLAESFVLYGEAIPGLPELTFQELTAQVVWVKPTASLEPFAARDADGSVIKSPSGFIMIRLDDVMVEYVRMMVMYPRPFAKSAGDGDPVADSFMLRQLLIEAADQYIRKNAEQVYDAEAKSMEQDYE